jgi:hypothetical protein
VSSNILCCFASVHKVLFGVEAGGEGHHFRVIQLPFNLSLTEAETAATQIVNGKQMSLLDAAQQLNISVVASASLMQVNS